MFKAPWQDEYELLGLPLTLDPYPDWPTHRLLEMAAREHPNSELIQNDTRLTYPEIKKLAWRLASALQRLGIKPGDRVATLLPTSVQFVIADYGIGRAGAVHVPSSLLEPPKVLAHKFSESTPRALVCLVSDSDEEMDTVKKLCADSKIPHLIFTRLSDFGPSPDAAKIDGAVMLADLIESGDDNPPEPDLAPDRDLETLLFTGGTTGLPKGCMLTHKNIVANALQSAVHFTPLNLVLNGNFAALLAIPFFHSYGHIMMHAMTKLGGSQILIPDPRDTKAVLDAIRRERPLFQFGVPTQYMKMLKEEFKDFKILGISGSAPLPAGVQDAFEQKGGGGIMEGYGLSECSPNTHLNPSLTIRLLGARQRSSRRREMIRWAAETFGAPVCARMDRRDIGKYFYKFMPIFMKRAARPEVQEDNKKASIGIPFHDTKIKVIDDEGRRLSYQELMEGKTGEMCITGPQCMLGYWPNRGEGLDDEGFVRTGDIVRMDLRGYFYIMDRTKDMINVSGYKVYSREIDELLFQHPAVDNAATIGVPDAERPGAEWVKVVVQLKPEFEGKTAEAEIREYLADKVAKYAMPRQIQFIREMPLTSVQKVDKKALRARPDAPESI